LDCGTIRPDRSDKTLKIESRNLDNLIYKIIPFFRKYKLKSSKSKDFDKFSKICSLIKKGEHRNREGMKRIIKIAYLMNSSGRRKYTKQKLLSILR